MKNRVIGISMAVLVATTAAFAYPTSPGQSCSVAPSWLVSAINAVLTSLGLGTVC